MQSAHEHGLEITINADGSRTTRPSKVVTDTELLAGSYAGGICVHEGAVFTIAEAGRLSGSLTFRSGSTGVIVGRHSGSLHVSDGASVEVVGDQSGSVHVDAGGIVVVAPTGRLAGSLHVAGLIENRGVRGGSVHLAGGAIHDIGGTVKQPQTSDGNVAFYNW